MSDFFWTSGHIGWGWFAVLVFTGLWWLFSDLISRLVNGSFHWLALMMSAGWIIGICLILVVFKLVG